MFKKHKSTILVVDDDIPLNSMICMFLEKHGFQDVRSFYNGDDLLKIIRKIKAPIIIQDYDLPDTNGVEILKKVRTINPDAEFIFLSGQSSIEVAVDSIKFGAFDYIIKDNFAKENVITKIKNLNKIKHLTRDRVNYKVILIALMVLLFASWLYVISIMFKV